MGSIGAFVAKEIREAIAPTAFFLVLFHLLGLTKAVLVDDYSFTALRASYATVGALIVAKAILLVEALPLARLFARRLAYQVLWKTVLFSAVALAFHVLEELVPRALAHGGAGAALEAMAREGYLQQLGIDFLWLFFGLLLYTLGAALARAIGHGRVRDMLLAPAPGSPES